MVTLMFMVDRALGGSNARKFRAVFPERALKGEKVVLMDLRYFVNIVCCVYVEVTVGRIVNGRSFDAWYKLLEAQVIAKRDRERHIMNFK